MARALLIRLAPRGPFRFGPPSGARDRTDLLFHSDALYSAVTHAMRQLGWLEEWLRATVGVAEPAVRFTSCFPYRRDLLFVSPPRAFWPPAGGSPRVHWRSARFVPWHVVRSLVQGERLAEDRWAVDAASGCLLPVERNSPTPAPFRVVTRFHGAVDRLTGISAAHSSACLQFGEDSGLWCLAQFSEAAEPEWADRITAAFRLLGDTGIGGQRTSGWGGFVPQFESVSFPEVLLGPGAEPEAPHVPPQPSTQESEDRSEALPEQPEAAGAGAEAQAEQPVSVVAEPQPSDNQAQPETGSAATPEAAQGSWWTLSLFSPAETDLVDWQRGSYSLLERSGRVEGVSHSGAVKRTLRMVEEGSVLVSPSEPAGQIRDVAPEGVGHPVYRSGLSVFVPLPARGNA